MVERGGYPAELRAALDYAPDFVIRGLVMDRVAGNVFKMDRFNHVGRGVPRPAARSATRSAAASTGRRRSTSPSRASAWIDTLFALPEASLFAGVVDFLEGRGQTVNYGRLCDDIRTTIDAVHRRRHPQVAGAPRPRPVLLKDLELGPALHRLRSGGKKLFPAHQLLRGLYRGGDALPARRGAPRVPELAELLRRGHHRRAQADLLLGAPALVELAPDRQPARRAARLRARQDLTRAGTSPDFERLVGIGGEPGAVRGDHIYGDILRSKKSSLCAHLHFGGGVWSGSSAAGAAPAGLEEIGAAREAAPRSTTESAAQRNWLNAVDRRSRPARRRGAGARELESERRRMKLDLERICGGRWRDANARIEESAPPSSRTGYNRYWGSRSGRERGIPLRRADRGLPPALLTRAAPLNFMLLLADAVLPVRCGRPCRTSGRRWPCALRRGARRPPRPDRPQDHAGKLGASYRSSHANPPGALPTAANAPLTAPCGAHKREAAGAS